MKKWIVIMSLIVSICCDGCANHQTSGDFGHFMIVKIKANGGESRTSTSLPQLTGKWSYSDDKAGTRITSNNITFEQVDHFLRSLYGVPSYGGKTFAGDVQWVVPARTAGVSIWYYREGQAVKITILKPLELN